MPFSILPAHTHSTANIVANRFPMARMPDGTLNYVLTAQGLGVDPVYAEAPPAPPPTGNQILERLQKHYGIWWFNDGWGFPDFLLTALTGTGGVDWLDDQLRPETGTTSLSSARVAKRAYGLARNLTWDRKRHIGISLRFSTISAQYIHIVAGGIEAASSSATTYHHIGFKLIDADLYATVANGTYENTFLLTTLTAATDLRLECILEPGVECRFWMNGTDMGALTAFLPTGVSYAAYLLHASVYNTEAASKFFSIYEYRFFEEE